MFHRNPKRHSAQARSRPGRPVRPRFDALEGRALLTTPGLDPTFGRGGVVLGPVDLDPAATYTQRSSRAVVQADGKIVVASSLVSSANATAEIVLQRFNPDGSVDSGFGDEGSVDIPVPSGFNELGANPGLAIAPDGDIVVAAGLSQFNADSGVNRATEESIIVRLTGAGRLDPTFAQGGEFVETLPGAEFGNVAVQADGKIVAAGVTSTGKQSPTAFGPGESQVTLIRLTTAGALDDDFNGTGTLNVVPEALNTFDIDSVGGLAIAPGGQIVVASDLANPIDPLAKNPSDALVTEVNSDGTLDSTFGTDGTVDASGRIAGVNGLVVQGDGGIVLSGTIAPTSDTPSAGLVRILANGSFDPSFQSAATAAPIAGTQISALALDADGDLTLAGRVYEEGPSAGDGLYLPGKEEYVVERYLPTGLPDPTFETNGTGTFYFAAPPIAGQSSTLSVADLESVSVTPTGSILLAGRLDIDSTSGAGYYGVGLGSQLLLAQVLPTTQASTPSPAPTPTPPTTSTPTTPTTPTPTPTTPTTPTPTPTPTPITSTATPPVVGPLTVASPTSRTSTLGVTLKHSRHATHLRRAATHTTAVPVPKQHTPHTATRVAKTTTPTRSAAQVHKADHPASKPRN